MLRYYRDKSQTLEQNYQRLGLSTKLNSNIARPKRVKGQSTSQTETEKHDSLGIASTSAQASSKPEEVRVERDPETGRILRVLQAEDNKASRNPLNDPLNDSSDEEMEVHETGSSNIVAQLEAQAQKEAEIEAKNKRPRQQSSREEEWIAKLVEAHGDDFAAMVRDRKLNPMQQSQGDISRRIKRWKQKHG